MFLDFIKKHKYTILLVLLILMVVIFVGLDWREGRMVLVRQGLADPTFPYQKYSILELARQGKVTDYVPELEEAVKGLPTRTTPQETFDIYIQALKDGDIERALECMDRGEQQRLRDFLYESRQAGRMENVIRISEDIKLRMSWDTDKIEKNSRGKKDVYYNYSCVSGDDLCGIGFAKNLYGDWKIDQFY